MSRTMQSLICLFSGGVSKLYRHHNQETWVWVRELSFTQTLARWYLAPSEHVDNHLYILVLSRHRPQGSRLFLFLSFAPLEDREQLFGLSMSPQFPNNDTEAYLIINKCLGLDLGLFINWFITQLPCLYSSVSATWLQFHISNLICFSVVKLLANLSWWPLFSPPSTPSPRSEVPPFSLLPCYRPFGSLLTGDAFTQYTTDSLTAECCLLLLHCSGLHLTWIKG